MNLDTKYALLTGNQMTRGEIATFKAGTPAFTLMLSAGRGLAGEILKRIKTGKVLFMNGPGNNGGDGWVAAELLRRRGFEVLCAALKIPDNGAGCAATDAYRKYQGDKGDFPNDINSFDVIIDALFGTGLTRDVEGRPGQWLKAANAAKALKVACDISSGVSADTGRILGVAFEADLTVTFSHKKRGLALMPGLEKSGEVVVHDIGIRDSDIRALDPRVFENDPALWTGDLPKPGKGAYKHKKGHVLVVGGAIEMSGAARMAARSALRSSAGLVTTLCPKEALAVYAEKQLSVMSRGYANEKEFDGAIHDSKYSAFVIGPGNGVGEGTKKRVLEVLKTKKSCVIDADGLTSFENDPKTLERALHPGCVITPHFGEFKRLWPKITWDDKVRAAEEVSKRTGAATLLKGPDTVISDGKTTIVNTHASADLATAGAGDVLAGLIAGFLAQGVEPLTAASIAAWIHGDASLRLGRGLIAEDLIEALPNSLKSLVK